MGPISYRVLGSYFQAWSNVYGLGRSLP